MDKRKIFISLLLTLLIVVPLIMATTDIKSIGGDIYEKWTLTETVDVGAMEDSVVQLGKDKKEFELNRISYVQTETESCIMNAELMFEYELQDYDAQIEYLNNKIKEYK